ncbi:hypothetical protein FRC17_005287 [Serendipita sp. 399]|nr:hypothetical protein FRC17_005287 [Serendipita sp. 399]
MEIGIVEAKFNIDYVLLRYPDDPVGGSTSPLNIVKIVVPSIVGTIIVAGSIGFWLWRRRRRRGWMSKFGQKRQKGNSEIALKDISGDETISGDGGDRGVEDGVHLPPPYPSRSELSLASERMRVSPHLIPLPSSTENAVSSQSGTNTTTTASGSQPSGSSHQLHLQPPVSSEREAELGPPRRPESSSLPTWSPPPPSYQSMISIMASESSMIPLSQDALERLYQRVTVLRRLNSQPSPSGGGGGGEKLGGIVEEDEAEGEEESDEELEALARRIAGIGTSSAARPEAEKR